MFLKAAAKLDNVLLTNKTNQKTRFVMYTLVRHGCGGMTLLSIVDLEYH